VRQKRGAVIWVLVGSGDTARMWYRSILHSGNILGDEVNAFFLLRF
jgi:hypothetical protein